MGLYKVPAYDSVKGNRALSVVVDDVLYGLSQNSMTYEPPLDESYFSHATADCISEFNNFLHSDVWRYLPFYYPNTSDILFLAKFHARIFQIFRESHSSAFTAVSPYDVSDDVTLNGEPTTLRDRGRVTDYSTDSKDYNYSVATSMSNSTTYQYPHTPTNRSRFLTGYSSEYGSYVEHYYEHTFLVFNSDVLDSNGDWNFTDETKCRKISFAFRYRIDNSQSSSTYGQYMNFWALCAVSSLNNLSSYAPVQSVESIYNEYEPEPIEIPDDPFIDPAISDLQPSDEGGGQGGGNQNNWGDGSEPNPIPNLPSTSVVDTGFITLFNPTVAQLKSLANYLWGGLFDVSTWKKIMADPMDAILGLLIVPVNVSTSGPSEVKVGNIGTGIQMDKAANQYYEFDCGTIQLDELWKSYLDYSPYTKLSIYLPYIGSQELDIDIMQTNAIGVKYHIDVLTGACVAFVTADGNVVSQFSGQCAVSIPVTSKDLTQTIMSLCTLVASGIGVVASGGMSAPVQAGMIAGAATAAANTAANVLSSKPVFSKSGNMSGSNGLLSMQRPYIMLEQPKQCVPMNQNRYTGYPSYITKQLGSISGFTQVQDIHLDGIPCTREERDEILEQLRTGVIL